MSIELYANLLLIGLAMLIAVSMVRFHNNPQYRSFNLVDLFTDHHGHISRPACMEVSAFIVVTWAVVVEVNRENFTEWLAGVYIGAFVLRAAHAAYLANGVTPKPVIKSPPAEG